MRTRESLTETVKATTCPTKATCSGGPTGSGFSRRIGISMRLTLFADLFMGVMGVVLLGYWAIPAIANEVLGGLAWVLTGFLVGVYVQYVLNDLCSD